MAQVRPSTRPLRHQFPRLDQICRNEPQGPLSLAMIDWSERSVNEGDLFLQFRARRNRSRYFGFQESQLPGIPHQHFRNLTDRDGQPSDRNTLSPDLVDDAVWFGWAIENTGFLGDLVQVDRQRPISGLLRVHPKMTRSQVGMDDCTWDSDGVTSDPYHVKARN